MSVTIRTERRSQRADRRVSRTGAGAAGKPSGQQAVQPKGALRYYLYHNNSKAFHEVRSGMRIGRAEGDSAGGHAIRVEDSLVSKEHCRIWIQGNALYVEDLGTVNTTRVNTVPMQPGARRKVLLHDVIEVGDQRFILTQQDRRPPAFTEDLTRRGVVPYRARRKSDGSLTAVMSGETFQDTLIAVNPGQYRELRLRRAVKSAGKRVRRRTARPGFREIFWLGIVMVALLAFLFGGNLHPLPLI